MAQSLAVKYRPKTFEEVLGQKSVLKILSRQLELNNLVIAISSVDPPEMVKLQLLELCQIR